MDDQTLADDCSLDSVPDNLRSAYFWYLQECNTEKTLTGAQWMRWRNTGTGKAEEFINREHASCEVSDTEKDHGYNEDNPN